MGYKAKQFTPLIDIDKLNKYRVTDFWEKIYCSNENSIILDPNAFYILASKEAVVVPPDHAAEMAAFNPLHGEFRVHYAGFFDPGFGEDFGSHAVLELRTNEIPFTLEDGQIIGRIRYEKLNKKSKLVYGSNINSNYQNQDLALSKHFDVSAK